MFKSVNIKNFKGLAKFEVNNLARVTLLGGRNNVGKTSVLEALFVYFTRFKPETFLRQHAWRNVSKVAINLDDLWAPMFSMYDLSKTIEISISYENSKIGVVTIKLNRNYTRRIRTQQSKVDTQIKSAPNVSLDVVYNYGNIPPEKSHHVIISQGQQNGLEVELENIRANQPETAFILSTGRISLQEDAIRFGQLDIVGKQQEVIDFIRETIEPRLLNLSTIAIGDQSLIHAQLEGLNRKIPVAYMGDGVSRLLSIILILTTTANGYVFIDEIENGIHYSALPKVWLGIIKAAQRFNCQVFATTHSYECLQAAIQGLPEELHNQFCYVRLERSGDHVTGKTYTHAMLGAALEMDWEVR